MGQSHRNNSIKEGAELGISELGHLKGQLVERLAIETDRYERIALEHHIDAAQRLIEGFEAVLATEESESIDSNSGNDPRALSSGDASAHSDHEASHATR